MTVTQKHLFYTELAKLLDAGFGIRQAALAMLDTRLPRAQAVTLRALNQALDAGSTITAAFGGAAAGISDLEHSLIGAGERGGRLATAFQHLADYFGMLAAVRADALKRLIYPVFVLHLGILVTVMPQPLIGGNAGGMSPGWRLLVTLLAVYAAGFSGVMLLRALLNAAPKHPRLERLLDCLPWVKRARGNLAMARFTKVYHMGILAGLSMVETAQSAASAAHNAALDEAGRALVLAVGEGQLLGPVMLASPAFPKAFARSYATAEQSGTLDKDLERWSALFQADAARAAASLATVLTSLLYGSILVFIGWGIWSFYSGYFKALEHFGAE